jgi:DNA polymerase-1
MLVTNETVGDLVDRIMSDREEPLAFDTETTGLSPVAHHIVGFSISCGNRHGVYVPLRHERILEEEVQVKQGRKKLGPPRVLRSEPHPLNLSMDVAHTIMRAVAESGRRVAMHNAAFDLSLAYREGWLFDRNEVVCTRVAKWLLCRGMRPLGNKPFGLKTLARKDLGYEMTEFEEVADPRGIQYSDPEAAAAYAADDARSTLRLWHRYEKEMREEWGEAGFLREFLELECPVVRVYAHMRRAGMLIDRDILTKCHGEVEQEQVEIQKKLDSLVEGEFPTSKTQKLSRLMFDTLSWWNPAGLERGTARAKDDPVGFYSTDEETLLNQLKIARDRRGKEVAILLLRWRKLETMRARYTLSLVDLADVDGRIRANFNQTGTDTGRASSNNPNLQNIPRPSDDDSKDVWLRKLPKIRGAFVSAPGWKMVDIDFSQIELRFMAHYSRDPKLIAAYRTWRCGACGATGEVDVVRYDCPNCGAGETYEKDGKIKKAKMSLDGVPHPGCFCLGMDIHQLTAQEVGCDRQQAKVVNFGLCYQMSAWLLGNTLGVSIDEAQRYVNRYFNVYQGVQQFHRRVEKKFLDDWYVRTMTGRHRRFDKVQVDRDDDGRPKGKYGHTIRAAINTIIQGSAADLMKIAMRNVHRAALESGELDKRFRILSTVHDELICEATEDYAQEAAKMMKREFEHAVKLRVPIVADPAVGHTWLEVH